MMAATINCSVIGAGSTYPLLFVRHLPKNKLKTTFMVLSLGKMFTKCSVPSSLAPPYPPLSSLPFHHHC